MEEHSKEEATSTLQTQPLQPPMLPPLPNATAALVLGILSIVFFLCYGIIGVILGIIGLVLGNKAVEQYKSSPGVYSEVSYKNANAGKICSIIGLSLSSVYIVILILVVSIFSTTALSTLF
ncbi:MAG: hypothetical protein LBF89_01405 [Bacteroidales bacterium]|jgi:hypothetical protein|nr:hypothetical protein [Bacteroidales bacterium]